MNEPSCDGLKQDQDIDCEADAVMRVGKTSIGADGEPSKNEDDRRQSNSDDLEPDMESQGPARFSAIKARYDDGCGDDEDEGDGRERAMHTDERVVLR